MKFDKTVQISDIGVKKLDSFNIFWIYYWITNRAQRAQNYSSLAHETQNINIWTDEKVIKNNKLRHLSQ